MDTRIKQKISDLKRYYSQKRALFNMKDSEEYNEEQYNHLMNFYNETIERKRIELGNIDKSILFQFDADRANETTISSGTEESTANKLHDKSYYFKSEQVFK